MSGFVQQAGWTQEEFEGVLRAAEEGFQASAHVRQVLPAGPEAKDRYRVTVPKLTADPVTLGVETSAFVVPVRLSKRFVIRSDQLQDLALVQHLARKAGQLLGAAESVLFTQGLAPARALAPLPTGQTDAEDVDHLSKSQGTVGGGPAAKADADADADADKAKTEKSRSLFDRLVDAVATLQESGHFGPHSFLATPKVMSEFASMSDASRHHMREGIAQLLGDGYRTAVFPKSAIQGATDLGLLISTGGRPLDVVVVDPPTVALVGMSDGDLTLQVEERVALRIIDSTAIVKIVKIA